MPIDNADGVYKKRNEAGEDPKLLEQLEKIMKRFNERRGRKVINAVKTTETTWDTDKKVDYLVETQ